MFLEFYSASGVMEARHVAGMANDPTATDQWTSGLVWGNPPTTMATYRGGVELTQCDALGAACTPRGSVYFDELFVGPSF